MSLHLSILVEALVQGVCHTQNEAGERHRFFMIYPYTKPLKRWIKKRRAKGNGAAAANAALRGINPLGPSPRGSFISEVPAHAAGTATTPGQGNVASLQQRGSQQSAAEQTSTTQRRTPLPDTQAQPRTQRDYGMPSISPIGPVTNRAVSAPIPLPLNVLFSSPAVKLQQPKAAEVQLLPDDFPPAASLMSFKLDKVQVMSAVMAKLTSVGPDC